MTTAGRLVDGKHLFLDIQAYLEHIHNRLKQNRTCCIGQSTTRKSNKVLNIDYIIDKAYSPIAPLLSGLFGISIYDEVPMLKIFLRFLVIC